MLDAISFLLGVLTFSKRSLPHLPAIYVPNLKFHVVLWLATEEIHLYLYVYIYTVYIHIIIYIYVCVVAVVLEGHVMVDIRQNGIQ